MTQTLTATEFERARKRLTGLAYRMLGSVAEAEDVVQDAFLRVSAIDSEHVSDILGYLHTTVARLCLDRLKSARARREVYTGTWLPEPVLDDGSTAPDTALELAHDVSFALLMTLERLTPPERTAFLLHDVFGQDYTSIAQLLERSEANCRKLAERARAQVHEGAPRFEADPADEQRLLEAFLSASTRGDMQGLTQLLAEDAVLYSDGGGKRLAPRKPVFGASRIARFLAGVRSAPGFVVPERVELRRVNQLPGYVIVYPNGEVAVVALEVRDGHIARLYLVNNPDKTHHLQGAVKRAN